MADNPQPEPAPVNVDEERLANALVSRGLITREEFQECRAAEGSAGPGGLLVRLVRAGFLTGNQARRAKEELDLLLGQQIPGYQLLDKLGKGSMGTVYKARQLSMDRLVAVKVLLPRLAANPDFLERFTREAHLAAKLSSNNIVQAINVGAAGPIHFFVMEYVEGTTIKEELEKGKSYAEREAVDIVLQIARALQHAHRRGLIHRDIKPANIILTADGVAKLADLGLARQTSDRALARAEKGVAVGTPFYIAPEQIRGVEDIDSRADIYSLGGTLYHMVAGQPPFPGMAVDVVIEAHLKEHLTPPDHLNPELSSGLGEVIEFMMAKDRRQRYRTPADLIIDLECLLVGAPPKLARQRMETSTLEQLAEGEAEDEDDQPGAGGLSGGFLWVWVLGGLLGASALANLVLLLR
jgi:eukaryotic-like serine/threonine-protein kinase